MMKNMGKKLPVLLAVALLVFASTSLYAVDNPIRAGDTDVTIILTSEIGEWIRKHRNCAAYSYTPYLAMAEPTILRSKNISRKLKGDLMSGSIGGFTNTVLIVHARSQDCGSM
jgi:hypothetical protein